MSDAPPPVDLRLLFEHLVAGVILHAPGGEVVMANPRACELMGMAETSMIGRGLHDPAWRLLHEDGTQMPVEAYPAYRVLADRTDLINQIVGVPHDASGTITWLLCNAYLDQGNEPDARRAVVMLMDISDRIAMRRALTQSWAERDIAAAASRQKSEFLAKVSHELRTPLNAVVGLTDVLLIDNALRSEDRDRLQHVHNAGAHLLHLIDDLLDVGALESGALNLVRRPVDPGELVSEVVSQCAPIAARFSVDVAVEPGAAAGHVLADPARLRQVVWNLLSNAIKYNKPGGAVRVRVARGHAGVEIRITDTGIGMTPEQQRGLFQAFNRLGRERSDVAGLGIGLSLSRHLLELMGGRIAVSSQPGLGTQFTIEMPLLQDAEATALHTAAAELDAHPISNLTLLYVDDDPVNHAVMDGIVQLHAGSRLLSATNAAEGLAIALGQSPDVILLDLLMPGTDGYQVLDAVKAQPALAATPCVAVSAFASEDDIHRAMRHGFSGYLTKPLTVERWRAEMHRVLG